MRVAQGGEEGVRVALLTNMLPPYRLRFLAEVERLLGELVVLVSARSEANRNWTDDNGALSVRQQRSIAARGRWRSRSSGFGERRTIHLPLDTGSQLRAIAPDVVISAELGFRTALASRYARRTGTPLICWATLSEATERDLDPARLRLRKLLARRVDHWIVNGESGKREVARYGVALHRISSIPQSITPRSSIVPPAPDKEPTRPLRLLYVGQLSSRKAILPFAHALEDWAVASGRTGDMSLAIVGDGPLRGELIQLAEASRVRIDLTGFKTYEDTVAEYQNHDVLVLPTLADEWAVVVNEALASGLPVLGSNQSQAVVEMITDGVHGFVFPPTREGYVAALDRLGACDRAVLRRMASASAQRAHDFAIEEVAPRVASLVRDVLSTSAQSSDL